MLPANQRSMVIYEYVRHCDSRLVGRTTQRLQERIKQHVLKAIKQKNTFTISFLDRTLQLRSLSGLVCGEQDLLKTKMQ